jgi:hypothetical protein
MSGLRKRPSGRLFARIGFLICAWTLAATAGFSQTFVPPTAPKDYKFLDVPGCQQQGQPGKLDLGTMSGTTPKIDDPDPHWLVTGPGISIPIAPYYTTLSAWTAPPNAWVEPVKASGGAANSSAASGDYTYTIWFNLNCPPESYSNLQITGTFAADNSATVYLNAFPVKSCTTNQCFGSATAFTALAPFQVGINSLSVVVHNESIYTGMTVSAELSGSCVDKVCVKESGLLKVCKVAGIGVPIGTPFSFTANGSSPFTVPAGAAPGGNCVVGPRFLPGTQVTVKEVGPTGYYVSSITVLPPPAVTTNLGVGGNVTVTMGNSVKETTFTNKAYAFVEKTGFLEICKVGLDKGNFTFMLHPGALGPFVVPAGSCSGAIEVPAGPVDIVETPTNGLVMLGCSTIPFVNQGPCHPSTLTSTVQVYPGNPSTIAYISNGRTPVPDDGLSNATGRQAR